MVEGKKRKKERKIKSLVLFVARAENVAFGDLGLNPAQQSNNSSSVVVIEDSLKGCLCMIHPYVL